MYVGNIDDFIYCLEKLKSIEKQVPKNMILVHAYNTIVWGDVFCTCTDIPPSHFLHQPHTQGSPHLFQAY